MHITREVLYNRIRDFFKEPRSGKVLAISGTGAIWDMFDKTKSELVEVKFPEVSIESLPFEDDTFDFIFSDQILEHIKNPFKAVDECYRVLKTGGYVIHTTCFMNEEHCISWGVKEYGDYWRFTPAGLNLLHQKYSEVVQCEGWGNREALKLIFAGKRWEEAPREVINVNEKQYAISTWIIAKK